MRKKGRFSILNLLIILLSIILACSIMITFFTFKESATDYYFSETSLYYSLKDREYSALARRYYENYIGNEEDPRAEKVKEYYAVGEYFEKAFFANAWKKAQDPVLEERYRRQMEEIEPQMGEFAGEKKQILKLFPDLE